MSDSKEQSQDEQQPETENDSHQSPQPEAGQDLQQTIDVLQEELDHTKLQLKDKESEAERSKEELDHTKANLKGKESEIEHSKIESAKTIEGAVDIAQNTSSAIKTFASQVEELAKKTEEQVAAVSKKVEQAEDKTGGSSRRNNLMGFIFGTFGALGFAIVIFMFYIFEAPTSTRALGNGLLINANAERLGTPTEDAMNSMHQKWLVKGTVVSNSELEQVPYVFVVLTDSSGNRFSVVATSESTDSSKPTVRDGSDYEDSAVLGTPTRRMDPISTDHVLHRFQASLEQIYVKNLRPTVTQITITARGKKPGFFSSSTLYGEASITPDLQRAARWSKASGAPFMASMIFFLVTFILSLLHTSAPIILRSVYYATVVLSLAFTAAMIVFISTTTEELAGTQRKDEVISLGFAHVFFGTYVSDTEPEWLLSLTTPPIATLDFPKNGGDKLAALSTKGGESVTGGSTNGTTRNGGVDVIQSGTVAARQEQRMVAGFRPESNTSSQTEVTHIKGFGAPIWLILLSVVGSAVFMIRLLVDSLKTSITFSPELIRARMAEIVRYQVYIFFAPLGAIFIYQLLVAAGSASEPITVGLAALAAGIGLNNLLEKAWKGAESGLNS